MAHFYSTSGRPAPGPRISGAILPVLKGLPAMIGLWGGPELADLDVQPNMPGVVEAIALPEYNSSTNRYFFLRGLGPGNVMVEARHKVTHGLWDSIQADVKDPGGVTVKDGKLVSGRVTVRTFSNLEHGDLDPVQAIVLHQTGGSTAQGTLDGYTTSSIGAHFLVDKDGTIYQTARVDKMAFHVGKIRSKCYEMKSCEPADQMAVQTILKAKKFGYSAKIKQLNDLETTKSYPARYPGNDNSLGIEVASELSKEVYKAPTSQQQDSVRWLLAELLTIFSLTTTDIYRHPEVSYKDATEAQQITWGN